MTTISDDKRKLTVTNPTSQMMAAIRTALAADQTDPDRWDDLFDATDALSRIDPNVVAFWAEAAKLGPGFHFRATEIPTTKQITILSVPSN
jgi:hypothetical protein